MERDEERLARIRQALSVDGLDALMCTLPANVLLVSGYWPVIGNAVAVVTREGAVAVVAPEDEASLAHEGWADVVWTFRPGSLDSLTTAVEAVRCPLAELATPLGVHDGAVLGIEESASFDLASYVSTFVYGGSVPHLARSAFPRVRVSDGSQCLARLRSVLTRAELERVRIACAIAGSAFTTCVSEIRTGIREFEVAATLKRDLTDVAHPRSGGFAYCMSGPNSARAHAAFQQTESRSIANGDSVLIHCNSYCDGFWTDITRTLTVGAIDEVDARLRSVHEAVAEARRCALEVIRPGVRASVVDSAAREVMSCRGFGDAFKHSTGHGVGFSAINHDALPRIHPLSDDVLETGMVFNIEPAAYIPGKYGVRHCDMVVVTADGADVLTPFQPQTK